MVIQTVHITRTIFNTSMIYFNKIHIYFKITRTKISNPSVLSIQLEQSRQPFSRAVPAPHPHDHGQLLFLTPCKCPLICLYLCTHGSLCLDCLLSLTSSQKLLYYPVRSNSDCPTNCRFFDSSGKNELFPLSSQANVCSLLHSLNTGSWDEAPASPPKLQKPGRQRQVCFCSPLHSWGLRAANTEFNKIC